MIPGPGEIVDLVNEGIYLIRGDIGNAVISGLATIPLGGQIPAGSRFLIRIKKAANGNKVVEVIAKGDDVGRYAKNIAERGFNEVPNGSAANHIFSGKPGKFTDTPTNRKIVQDVSNNSDNYLGKDQFGKDWYAKTENGKQTYSYTQNGVVKGAGINNPPLDIIKDKGLTK